MACEKLKKNWTEDVTVAFDTLRPSFMLPDPLNTLAQTVKPAAMARVGLRFGETGAFSGGALLLLFLLGGLFGLLLCRLLCCFLIR